MTAWFPFLLIFGFILTVLLLNGLSWFYNKELQERRELDLQILALDHGATFSKSDIRLVNRLSQFDQQLSYSFLNQIKIYNVTSKGYDHYRSHFFEIASPTKDKSNQPVLQNGIVVEFNDELPYRFDIGRKEIWDWMNRDSHPRIESYLNPSWLPTQFSVYAPRDEQKIVHNLLQGHHVLSELVQRKGFIKMVVCHKYAAVYYAGIDAPNLHNFQRKAICAAKIAHFFHNHMIRVIADGVEIRLLKPIR